MESLKLTHSNGCAVLAPRPLYKVISTLFVVAVVAPAAPVAYSQASGIVPASCTINAATTGIDCSLSINLSGVTGTFINGTLSLSPGTASPPPPPPPPAAPTCTAVTPPSQTTVVGINVSAISANCLNATSYQWYSGSISNPILGATSATYLPPTNVVGTSTYQVRATNASGFVDNVSSATVTVTSAVPPPPPSQSCPAGEPRLSVAFTSSLNFPYISIVGSGASSLFIAKITVGANDTTINKNILPSFAFTQDDTTLFSDRTVTLSQTCNDFSASARVLMSGQLGGSISFVTARDGRASANVATFLTPGVWYINVRNDTCPQGGNCAINGIWRNWNK